MSLPNTQVDAILAEMVCGECGILFAMPRFYLQARRGDHKNWHCPNGHERYYPDQSEEEKLKTENEKLRTRLDWKKNEIEGLTNQLRSTKGVVTKFKNRIKSGVCPYCNRSFSKLKAHMESKHNKGK